MKKRSKLRLQQASVSGTVMVCLLLTITVIPFYVMLVGAFKPNMSLIQIPTDLNPFTNLTLKNMKAVFEKADILLWMKNSLIISLSVAALTASSASPPDMPSPRSASAARTFSSPWSWPR